jgi:hypothetical protein
MFDAWPPEDRLLERATYSAHRELSAKEWDRKRKALRPSQAARRWRSSQSIRR